MRSIANRVRRALRWRVRLALELALLTVHGLRVRAGTRSRAQPDSNGDRPRRERLISPDYHALQQEMHRETLEYGVSASGHLHQVKLLSRLISRDILDYGCGKQLLQAGLVFPIQSYDPGIPGLDDPPNPADVVVCLGVLEHIEPEKLDGVLSDLRRVTRRAGYFMIGTQPAVKSLPDGRNAHLIVEGADWWARSISEHFNIHMRLEEMDRVTFLVKPRKTALCSSDDVTRPVGSIAR